MFDVNTADVRRFFARAWANRFAPGDALQAKAARIVAAHPEYRRYVEHVEDWLDHDWLPENGESNPFLHMSLHLSLQEQASIDQPFGIADIHRRLCAQTGDWVRAEDMMMEALAEMIWSAQRHGTGFDVNAYMNRLRRLAGLGEEERPRLNPHEL